MTTMFVDPRRFRDALSHYPSGITVITGAQGAEPVGFTCQSFYSVSMAPPLVSFSVQKTSTSYPRIRPSERFCVNVLAHDQQRISNQFARSGTDKWAGVSWHSSALGNPVLADTVMWLDCTTWAEHDAGDHLIIVGEVSEMSTPDWHKGDPLLFFQGTYRQLRHREDPR
ncbi:flavin reductase family protein [Cryptosporangium aurantiacum]|uniref:NADH-FMN oxidoreductase RutF, flavin reductase (DIM6/NTAB) family n=1 Tax=Cryptosporangium aurantiacum TaxID=134849 RepID=A0A1M7RNM2_9ACTN|nr:flavin reductase family protein [Cryptosporangium aurantiacum]SHN47935.1 NADH-FMN oxidoreductase RutF, flavin reductase (DIM6/NTAB) family [Cryptosporangium aurantiacum]